MRLYTDKDLFPEKTERAKEERTDVAEVKPHAQQQNIAELQRQVIPDSQWVGTGEKELHPFGKPKSEETKGKAQAVKRESMDEFISKLLYRKNSWDVSIMDLLVVSFAIFVMLMFYFVFLG